MILACDTITLARVDDGVDGADGQMLYATCATAAGTAAKVASISAGSLTISVGASVAVKFTYGNTAAAPTLNVASTGAKKMYLTGAVVSSSNPFYWSAGTTIIFVYNGTYWVVADSGAAAATAKLELLLSEDTDGNIISVINEMADVINLESNRLSISSDYFTLSADGKITATSGTIGGFTIGSTSIYTKADAFGTTASNIYIGASGISLGTTFKVTAAGALTATSGTIGAWTLTSTALYAGTSSSTSTTAGMYMSKTVFRQYGSASAYVHIANGVITAIGAKITGAITATSLTLSGNMTASGVTVTGNIQFSTQYYAIVASGDTLEMASWSGLSIEGSPVTITSTGGYITLNPTTQVNLVDCDAVMSNGQALCWGDASGTSTAMARMTTGNLMYFGNASYSTYVQGSNLYLGNASYPTYIRGSSISAPQLIQSGTISITPSAANTPTAGKVTFGTAFPAAPKVVATALSTVPGTTVTGVGVSGISTTGCTIYLTRTNTTATTIYWIAVYTP